MKEYTVKVCDNGSKCWYLDGKFHREDGPAVERADNEKEWWLNGQRHREDGPAIIRSFGDKFWYLHGKLHREDGPAAEFCTGDKEWWLHGEWVTEEEHKRRTGGTTMKDALARLVRIMGTFDLATGHADTMDQALDALEEELRDVLGHLRARRVANGEEQ